MDAHTRRREQLIYYSLFLPADEARPDLVWQLEASLRSLRSFNRDIAVVLFAYGDVPAEVAQICAVNDVMLHLSGPYELRLATLCPPGWPALSKHPLLHKFLNFSVLAASGASRVLYLDVDTVLRADVQAIFDKYGTADVVAREEVHTSRSPYGTDARFVDEALLRELADHEDVSLVAPFNTGVVLFNHGVAGELAQLEGLFVDYAWRFMTWMSQEPAAGGSSGFGDIGGTSVARQLASWADHQRALPFPSLNRWLLDEAALWLTLGHLPGPVTADFSRSDVAQDGEFYRSDPDSADWVLCHYFSQNTSRVAEWLSHDSAMSSNTI